MENKDYVDITDSMEHYKKIQRFDIAIGYMTLASICVTFLGVFAKLTMQMTSLTLIVFLRFFIPFLLSLCVLIPMGTLKRVFKSKSFGNQFLRGIAAVASQYFLFYCLSRVSLFNTMMLWNTTPVFIPLVSWILYKHHISKATWVSVILGLLGVVCVIKPDGGIVDWFSIWGVLAGVATAFSQTLYGRNARRVPLDENMFFIYFTGSLVSVVGLVIFHLILKDDFLQILQPIVDSGVKPYLFILALSLYSIGNQFFKGKAYRHSSPSMLSPFFYLAVLFSGLLGWIVFNHIPDFLAIFGMILIIFSTIIRITFAPKSEQIK